MDNVFGLNMLPQNDRFARSAPKPPPGLSCSWALRCGETELPHIIETVGYCQLTYGTDVCEHAEDCDAIDFLGRAVEAVAWPDIDGVMASDDYPGSIVAAANARRLRLPDPNLAAVLWSGHEYYTGMAQWKAASEAVLRVRAAER
jgi:hypothetical protein